MLYKRLGVIRAMAEVVCPIPLPRLDKLLMSLGIWLMLLAADEEAVRCHVCRRGLLRYDVPHVMAQEISNKMSDATSAMAQVQFINKHDISSPKVHRMR